MGTITVAFVEFRAETFVGSRPVAAKLMQLRGVESFRARRRLGAGEKRFNGHLDVVGSGVVVGARAAEADVGVGGRDELLGRSDALYRRQWIGRCRWCVSLDLVAVIDPGRARDAPLAVIVFIVWIGFALVALVEHDHG